MRTLKSILVFLITFCIGYLTWIYFLEFDLIKLIEFGDNIELKKSDKINLGNLSPNIKNYIWTNISNGGPKGEQCLECSDSFDNNEIITMDTKTFNSLDFGDLELRFGWIYDENNTVIYAYYSDYKTDVAIAKVVVSGSDIDTSKIKNFKFKKTTNVDLSKIKNLNVRQFEDYNYKVTNRAKPIKRSVKSSSESNTKVSFQQAKQFMKDRLRNLNQTMFDSPFFSDAYGVRVYVFLSKNSRGYLCISIVSSQRLELINASCGGPEKLREWYDMQMLK